MPGNKAHAHLCWASGLESRLRLCWLKRIETMRACQGRSAETRRTTLERQGNARTGCSSRLPKIWRLIWSRHFCSKVGEHELAKLQPEGYPGALSLSRCCPNGPSAARQRW